MQNLNFEFLKRLQGKNGVTEISDLKRNLGGIDKYGDLINSNKDLFFISFFPNLEWMKAKENSWKLPRTKDIYIKEISYIKADFDIRRIVYEREHRVISEKELLAYKDKILEGLRQDEDLCTYNAVIHSGNGIHVYWIAKPTEIDPQHYTYAVTQFYNVIKEMFPDEPHLWPDFACANLSRLMRLPGSWNNKTKYGLPPHEVKILEYKSEDSPLVNRIKEYPYAPDDRKRRYWDIYGDSGVGRLDDLGNYLRRGGLIKNGNNLYDRINTEIKIEDLVCEYTGWKFAKNKENFISNRDGTYTGAFVIKKDNIVVHRGTPHFSDVYKVYSPFAFLMVHYANGDPKRTFEIAKEKFPRLIENKSKFLSKKKLVKNGKRK